MDTLYKRFFGDPWPSGLCKDGIPSPTPVGMLCHWCGVPIAEGDQGSFIMHLGENGSSGFRPIHRECSLRSVVGSPRHLRRQCSCYGSPEPECDTTETPEQRRAEALESWTIYSALSLFGIKLS